MSSPVMAHASAPAPAAFYDAEPSCASVSQTLSSPGFWPKCFTTVVVALTKTFCMGELGLTLGRSGRLWLPFSGLLWGVLHTCIIYDSLKSMTERMSTHMSHTRVSYERVCVCVYLQTLPPIYMDFLEQITGYK